MSAITDWDIAKDMINRQYPYSRIDLDKSVLVGLLKGPRRIVVLAVLPSVPDVADWAR